MHLRRLWNSWAPHELRHVVSPTTFALSLLLVTLTFATVYYLDLISIFDPSVNWICFSELSLRRARHLNASARVRIIPSSVRDRSLDPDGGKVEEDAEIDSSLLNTPCVPVHIPPFKSSTDSVLVCIHDPEKDKIISAYLKRHSEWERENVEALRHAHIKHPGLMLVDLGCNLGAFTLPAAKMGMQVLAVDAMLASLKLLQKSLLINGLSCHVTLLHNALYRQRMRMRVAFDPKNVGGSRVVELLASRKDKVAPKDLVDAICLNDLVPLVKGREVFLKMDIEETEDAVLECADRFFTEVNVKVLLLEWLYFRNQEEKVRTIIDFLFRHGMRPTWGFDTQRDIDIHSAHAWPDNVLWVKTV